HKNLWLIALDTGAERQLTNLTPDFDIRDFDVSPDGREVVLERVQERSDTVLLDLPRPEPSTPQKSSVCQNSVCQKPDRTVNDAYSNFHAVASGIRNKVTPKINAASMTRTQCGQKNIILNIFSFRVFMQMLHAIRRG